MHLLYYQEFNLILNNRKHVALQLLMTALGLEKEAPVIFGLVIGLLSCLKQPNELAGIVGGGRGVAEG